MNRMIGASFSAISLIFTVYGCNESDRNHQDTNSNQDTDTEPLAPVCVSETDTFPNKDACAEICSKQMTQDACKKMKLPIPLARLRS
jgi:hypothetical protein